MSQPEKAEQLIFIFRTVIWESLDPAEEDFVERVVEVSPHPFRPMVDRGAAERGGAA